MAAGGRGEKIAQVVQQVAATFIERESNKQALITVTRVEVINRGRGAMIYFTVLPESGEEAAFNFLKRKRPDIREILTKQLRIHPIPFLDVEIDKGEKARQTIDALLKE